MPKTHVAYWILSLGLLVGYSDVACGEADGRKVFDANCKKCHGELGKPTERGKSLGAPDFTNRIWQLSRTDEQIIQTITNGKGKMPNWKDELTPEEINAVARWVRVLGPKVRG
ncbi:MAG TPA: c-type cytochrome [Candidatus Tripitaka californicus]|uniref:c-type cytochrome n=1 Tax=Candidatus Tripitaka californicus TaxID=3367616 RepID=UPI004029CAE2